ncbi:MAG: hypothetical protein A3F10_07435 [Coxiella sp. RIFCSPHIGHO2_12_FULL_42_15]|nr:MAG: hypothetical protein A3F10_07435 [Coxiella sp. RIFCSPHIGHO2_12_FULL_42_15]
MSKKQDRKSTEIYADGMGFVVLLGGMIRANLIKFIPDEANPEKPKIEVDYNLIMSPQAFMQMTGVVNDFMQKLKDSGMIVSKEKKKEE